MKALKNKTIMLLIALALVLSISLGLTFAYFSDYTAAKGGATLTLGSSTELHEDPHDGYKDITIENTGDTDVVVRVGVYGPSTMTVDDVSGSGWVNNGEFWYFNQVLTAHSTTPILKATVKAPEGDVDNFDVVVVHESAQVTYDEAGKVAVPDGWYNAIN